MVVIDGIMAVPKANASEAQDEVESLVMFVGNDETSLPWLPDFFFNLCERCFLIFDNNGILF